MKVVLMVDNPGLRKQTTTLCWENINQSIEGVTGLQVTDKHIYGYANTPKIRPFIRFLKHVGFRTHFGTHNYKYVMLRDLLATEADTIILITSDKDLAHVLPNKPRVIVVGFVPQDIPGVECVTIL